MCAVSALYRHKGFKFPNLSKNHWPNVLQNSNLLHVLEEFPQHFHVRAIEMPRRPTGSHAAAEFRKYRDGSEGIADLGLGPVSRHRKKTVIYCTIGVTV